MMSVHIFQLTISTRFICFFESNTCPHSYLCSLNTNIFSVELSILRIKFNFIPSYVHYDRHHIKCFLRFRLIGLFFCFYLSLLVFHIGCLFISLLCSANIIIIIFWFVCFLSYRLSSLCRRRPCWDMAMVKCDHNHDLTR